MTGSNNLESYLERNRRLERRAWVFTLIPLLIFAVLICILGYSSHRLKTLLSKIAASQEKLSTVDRDLAAKQTALDQINAAVARFRQNCGLAQNVASASSVASCLAAKEAVVESTTNNNLPPLVTIQIAYRSQLNNAKAIAAHLRRLGYSVPPDDEIEIRGTHISQNNYLRFFFKSDEALANTLLRQIRDVGVDAELFSFADETDREALGSVLPRQFEFRLGLKYVPQTTLPAKGNSY